MLNWLRALKQVYGYEVRLFFYIGFDFDIKIYNIEDTTKWERVKMYKQAWDTIGYVRGIPLLNHFKSTGARINIYQLKYGELNFLYEYEEILK